MRRIGRQGSSKKSGRVMTFCSSGGRIRGKKITSIAGKRVGGKGRKRGTWHFNLVRFEEGRT